jgi:hypothetical protein
MVCHHSFEVAPLNRSIVALLALAVTASCGDSGTDPDEFAASGSVGFSYNGGTLLAAGSYNASGGLPLNPNDTENRTWAAGYRDTENTNNVGIVANVARGDRTDVAIMYFDRSTAGTSTVDADCDIEAGDCAGMVFWYNLSESGTATGQVLCGLETGTMTIATLTATRATGSFSGTGSCLGSDFTTQSSFTVTNGSFDVPIVQDPGIGTGLRMMSRSRR